MKKYHVPARARLESAVPRSEYTIELEMKPWNTAALRYRIDSFTLQKLFHSRDADKRFAIVERGVYFKTAMTSSTGRCNMEASKKGLS